MRRLLVISTLCLALTPALALAQDVPPALVGSIDFGVRGTSITGDNSRHERFRDLGDGLFLESFRWKVQASGWFMDFAADHAGRKDQRYTAAFAKPGQFKGWAQWDQIPMLLSTSTRTPFSSTVAGEFRLDDAVQLGLQNLSSTQRPAALLALVNGSPTFELKSRRDTLEGGFELLPTLNSSIKVNVRRADREGAQPYGAAWGHSQVVEFAAPVDHRLTDIEASAEVEKGPALLRAGYTGSWFTNNVTSAIVDNPLRATDISGTAASARLSLPVSNTLLGVNGMVSVKLPSKSRLTAYGTLSTLKDDNGAILPLTINSALAPSASALSRSTLDGEARISGLNLSFTSRPNSLIALGARMKYYDYDNRTASVTLTQRVGYDGSLSNLATPTHTEVYGVKRLNFDADVRFSPKGPAALTLAYGRYADERTHRIFEETVDNVFRAKLDTLSTGIISVRAMYERAQRRGSGFDVDVLTHANEQPGMRHYDLADRDRDRFTLVASFMPVANWALNVSSAIGRDDYNDSLFGLRDNNHDVYTIGFDGTPSERVGLSASYSYEDYRSLQRSRQANPGVQFTDPSRNWATDADDTVHSVVANLDLMQLAEKLDLHLSWDYNRTRATYEYITGAVPDRTLPEEVIVDTTLPTPVALPPVKSDLWRGTVDAIYNINRRIAIGVTYWYDKYKVEDFTLDSTAQNTLTAGTNVLLYYTYAPYTAHTTWGRLIVRW